MGLQEKVLKIGIREPLLLLEGLGKALANLLLIRLISGRFARGL